MKIFHKNATNFFKQAGYKAFIVTLVLSIASLGTFLSPSRASARVQGYRLIDCYNILILSGDGWVGPGDRGGCVWVIQYFLNQWRYLNRWAPIRYDGIYGEETKGAVKWFQAIYGIAPQDGLAGRTTLRRMQEVCVSWDVYFDLRSPACRNDVPAA